MPLELTDNDRSPFPRTAVHFVAQAKKAGACNAATARPEDQPISPAAMRNFLPSGSV